VRVPALLAAVHRCLDGCWLLLRQRDEDGVGLQMETAGLDVALLAWGIGLWEGVIYKRRKQ
jgi:hypothetical protein